MTTEHCSGDSNINSREPLLRHLRGNPDWEPIEPAVEQLCGIPTSVFAIRPRNAEGKNKERANMADGIAISQNKGN